MNKKTQYAILGVLSIEDSSGYEIRKFLEENVSHFWKESFGQIYPVLHQLKKNQFVKAIEKPTGKRKKTIYSINKNGFKELDQWICNSDFEIQSERNELLLKLFFSLKKHYPCVKKQIEIFQTKMKKQLHLYDNIENYLIEFQKNQKGFNVWYSTLRFGQITSDAQIKWAEETLKIL